MDLDQKPIVAKLVRLGEKRPEQFLPRKEEPPPPAPPAPPSAAPVVAAAPKPTAPAPSAKAPPAPPSPPSRTAGGKAGGTTLASVMSKVQREVEASRWGSPDGDPMGDSDTGSEGDRYLALVVRELRSHYNLSRTISDRELVQLGATVVLRIDNSGRVLGHAFERRSGNAAYDAALERAIAAVRLPPPPPELRDRFRTAGLGVNFHL
jgi:colicin import membrane protein/protein TonB